MLVHDRFLVHRDDGFRSRWAVAQCTMRPLRVVMFPPLFDDNLRFFQGVKDREGDLITGSKNSHIATLVERHTRYVMLVKVPNKETQTVVSALIKQAKKLPAELYKSLTWDRGKELAGHKQFTLATDIDVYFCDPQSPWQRGSNENTNGLLRQYFPKGTDLSVYSQSELNKVARQLNERPRKTLEFETPAERFNACVASTG